MRPFLLVLAATVLATAVAGEARAASGLKPTIAPDADDNTTAAPPKKSASDDPYAALGLRAGNFILYPSVTVGVGYTTNAGNTAGGTASTFSTVVPELLIQSDWDRNAASLDLRGSYQKFFDDSSDDDPEGSADATARLDLPHDWTADFAAGVDYRHDTLDDVTNPPDAPSGVTSLTSSADITGDIGRAAVTLEGSADRTLYADTTTAGVPIDQSDRNNSVFGARLRVGYDSGGGTLTPFVEGEVARSVYDQTVDSHGLRRSGTALSARAGVEFDSDPVLTGEIALGTTQENFDDPALASLAAFTVDGNLVWSPSRLTTVTFDGSTTLNPSTDPASSGSVVHDGSVEVAYDWRDNVMLSGKAEVSHEAYQGTGEVDDTYDLDLDATWKLNRTLQLSAGYTHEWLASNDPSNDYQSDTVKVELRAQR